MIKRLERLFFIVLIIMFFAWLYGCTTTTIITREEDDDITETEIIIPTPNGLSAVLYSDLNIGIAWQANADDEVSLDGFEIKYKKPQDEGWSTIELTSDNDGFLREYTLTGTGDEPFINQGAGTYLFKVITVGPKDEKSGWSVTFSYEYKGYYMHHVSTIDEYHNSHAEWVDFESPSNIFVDDNTAFEEKVFYLSDNLSDEIARFGYGNTGKWAYKEGLESSSTGDVPPDNISFYAPYDMVVEPTTHYLYFVDKGLTEGSPSSGRILQLNPNNFSTNCNVWYQEDLMAVNGSLFTVQGNEQIFFPNACEMNERNILYVSDVNNHRILRIIFADKDNISEINSYGSESIFKSISAIALGNSKIYVADTYYNRVLQVNFIDNTYLVLASGLNQPKGLAVDTSVSPEQVYIADTNNNKIKVFEGNITSEGDEPIHSFGIYGSDNAEFCRPAGLFFLQGDIGETDKLYVTELGDSQCFPRIQIFEKPE